MERVASKNTDSKPPVIDDTSHGLQIIPGAPFTNMV